MAKIVIDKNFHPGGIVRKVSDTFTPDIRRSATRPALTSSNIRSTPTVRKKGK